MHHPHLHLPLLHEAFVPVSFDSLFTYLDEPLFYHRRYLSNADIQILERADDYLSGLKKQELVHWWLQYIEDNVDKYLAEKGYDPHVVPYHYIDHPPSSMQAIQTNLRVVRHLLDALHKVPGHPSTHIMHELVDPLKQTVYEPINHLCHALRLVIWDQFNQYKVRLDLHAKRDLVFIEEAYLQLQAMNNHIPQDIGHQLREIISDLVYITKMKKMDDNFFISSPSSIHTAGPSDIVPVTGLIANRLHRVENELKTVLDHWKGRIPQS